MCTGDSDGLSMHNGTLVTTPWSACNEISVLHSVFCIQSVPRVDRRKMPAVENGAGRESDAVACALVLCNVWAQRRSRWSWPAPGRLKTCPFSDHGPARTTDPSIATLTMEPTTLAALARGQGVVLSHEGTPDSAAQTPVLLKVYAGDRGINALFFSVSLHARRHVSHRFLGRLKNFFVSHSVLWDMVGKTWWERHGGKKPRA